MSDMQFRCAKCGGTFTKGWSGEEAAAEHARTFTKGWSGEETAAEHARTFTKGWSAVGHAVVCDPCYQEFLRWLDEHLEERHRHGWT